MFGLSSSSSTCVVELDVPGWIPLSPALSGPPPVDAADATIAQYDDDAQACVAASLKGRNDRVEIPSPGIWRVSCTLSPGMAPVWVVETAGRLFAWLDMRRGIAMGNGDESRMKNGLWRSVAAPVLRPYQAAAVIDSTWMPAPVAGVTIEALRSGMLPKEAVEHAIRICELHGPRRNLDGSSGRKEPVDVARGRDVHMCELRQQLDPACSAPTCRPGRCLCRGA